MTFLCKMLDLKVIWGSDIWLNNAQLREFESFVPDTTEFQREYKLSDKKRS